MTAATKDNESPSTLARIVEAVAANPLEVSISTPQNASTVLAIEV
jgi:hypothetical protein